MIFLKIYIIIGLVIAVYSVYRGYKTGENLKYSLLVRTSTFFIMVWTWPWPIYKAIKSIREAYKDNDISKRG